MADVERRRRGLSVWLGLVVALAIREGLVPAAGDLLVHRPAGLLATSSDVDATAIHRAGLASKKLWCD